jgi:hypothetical protein
LLFDADRKVVTDGDGEVAVETSRKVLLGAARFNREVKHVIVVWSGHGKRSCP